MINLYTVLQCHIQIVECQSLAIMETVSIVLNEENFKITTLFYLILCVYYILVCSSNHVHVEAAHKYFLTHFVKECKGVISR